MHYIFRPSLIAVCVLCRLGFTSVATGQDTNLPFGAGYSSTTPISMAPGQIVNLFVTGVGASLTGRVAASQFPLPLSLANISVALQQTSPPQSVNAPILAVRRLSTCLNSSAPPCGSYIAVTIQVPFELQANTPGSGTIGNFAHLVVSENGVAGSIIDINPVLTQVHILNGCDVNATSSLACSPTPIITHADGTAVSTVSLAQPGEALVMYAFGLGTATSTVETGHPTPDQAPVASETFFLNFDYRPNALATGLPGPLSASPLFAGLTPGLAGLYQVNFVVPKPPSGTPPCVPVGLGGLGVTSNLTVSLINRTSYDGARICVDVSQH